MIKVGDYVEYKKGVIVYVNKELPPLAKHLSQYQVTIVYTNTDDVYNDVGTQMRMIELLHIPRQIVKPMYLTV
mgnify:CR=1 FL=1